MIGRELSCDTGHLKEGVVSGLFFSYTREWHGHRSYTGDQNENKFSSEIMELEMETVRDYSDGAREDDAELLWKNAAQPLIKTMKLFGLYHEETSKKQLESRSLLKKTEFLVLKIYHLLIVGLLWWNFIRSIVSFVDHLSIIFDLLPRASWLFYVASNSAVLFKISYKQEIIKIIAYQSKSCLTLQRKGGSVCHDISSEWRNKRSVVVVGVTVAIIFICLNMALVAYQVFTPFFANNQVTSGGIECLPWNSTVACGLLTVLNVYATAAWILSVAFFAFICRILAGQLDELKEDFRRTFCNRDAINGESLDLYRRYYLTLCRSVEMADTMFSPFVAVTYSVNISNLIFLLYQISFSCQEISPIQ